MHSSSAKLNSFSFDRHLVWALITRLDSPLDLRGGLDRLAGYQDNAISIHAKCRSDY